MRSGKGTLFYFSFTCGKGGWAYKRQSLGVISATHKCFYSPWHMKELYFPTLSYTFLMTDGGKRECGESHVLTAAIWKWLISFSVSFYWPKWAALITTIIYLSGPQIVAYFLPKIPSSPKSRISEWYFIVALPSLDMTWLLLVWRSMNVVDKLSISHTPIIQQWKKVMTTKISISIEWETQSNYRFTANLKPSQV